jgi:hypothetical protein
LTALVINLLVAAHLSNYQVWFIGLISPSGSMLKTGQIFRGL